MNIEDLNGFLDLLGVDPKAITAEAREKVQVWLDAHKAELDTQTRRKVRSFWIGVSCITLLIGFGLGYFAEYLFR